MASQRDLNSGELAVLAILAGSRELRWFRQLDVLNALPPALRMRAFVLRTLSALRRDQLVVVHYRGWDSYYAITTTGEAALRRADQMRLAV